MTKLILALVLAPTHIGLWSYRSYTTNRADIAFAQIYAVSVSEIVRNLLAGPFAGDWVDRPYLIISTLCSHRPVGDRVEGRITGRRTATWLQLRRERLNDFFEARIAAERVP